jgi:hypothetical protein
MYSYVNDLRRDMATDWAGIIFVVDDWNDQDNMFADEDPTFGYAKYWIQRTTLQGYVLMHGGPCIVMTYDNDEWGHEDMPDVLCHELGHMFGCPDEYPDGFTCREEGMIPDPFNPDCHSNYGYLFNANHNCSACNDSPADCIMRGWPLEFGLCDWSNIHLGWYDDDADGVAKPIDPNSGKIAYVRGVTPGDVLDFSTLTGEFIKRLTVTEANTGRWNGIRHMIWTVRISTGRLSRHHRYSFSLATVESPPRSPANTMARSPYNSSSRMSTHSPLSLNSKPTGHTAGLRS